MHKLIILTITMYSFSLSAKIVKIIDTQTKKSIDYNSFIRSLPETGFIVLGEFHNTPHIQKAEAQIIEDKSSFSSQQENINIMWEFMNFTDQENINKEYKQLLNGDINAETFITNTAGAQNLDYVPIFNVAKRKKANIFGLNVSRAIKKKLMTEGIDSLDPSLIPANMEVGGADYRERFSIAMGGHAPEDVLAKYFLAQCYTDSIMSYKAYTNESQGLNFIIAGSFHTDYFDGTVSRLKKLTSSPITTLKIIDENMIENLNETIYSTKFGNVADFVVFTQED